MTHFYSNATITTGRWNHSYRYALPTYAPYKSSQFSSVRKKTIWKLHRETAPEYTASMGTSERCPQAMKHVLWWLSCLTSNTKCAVMHLYPSGTELPLPMSLNMLYSSSRSSLRCAACIYCVLPLRSLSLQASAMLWRIWYPYLYLMAWRPDYARVPILVFDALPEH